MIVHLSIPRKVKDNSPWKNYKNYDFQLLKYCSFQLHWCSKEHGERYITPHGCTWYSHGTQTSWRRVPVSWFEEHFAGKSQRHSFTLFSGFDYLYMLECYGFPSLPSTTLLFLSIGRPSTLHAFDNFWHSSLSLIFHCWRPFFLRHSVSNHWSR